MSGKKLHSELESVSAKLSGLVEEARYKEPDIRIKMTEKRTLTKSLTSLREKELHHEKDLDRKMEEFGAFQRQRAKNHLEETKDLRMKKEIQSQLLEASKIELDILKREMNKLKEAKINLLKEMESHKNKMNNEETETSSKDVDEDEVTDKTELKTERQTVEEIEKSLSDLKKKSVQLVSAVRTEKDILRREIAHLREITVKRAQCKREIKEFEKKELEKKSAEMKENREKKGNKVAAPEIQQFGLGLGETEEDQLLALDEEITKTELKHRAVLVEIDEVLGGTDLRAERREKSLTQFREETDE